MASMDNTTQRRITFLSLLSSASTYLSAEDAQGEPYERAIFWLSEMVRDNFFEAEAPAPRPTSPPSSGPRPTFRRPASPSRPPTRGRDNQPFTGQLRDPDGPPTDKQVAAALKLTDEYSEDDLYSFTKQQVSDLISDLKG